MRKLLRGIIDFRRNLQPGALERYARLALGQSPDTLFIACSDSRVVPNLFASTDPGDLFVVRNMGNLVAPCGPDGVSRGELSEAAAIEFAVDRLRVRDIIVCGHSECGAMHAIAAGNELDGLPNMRAWLKFGDPRDVPPRARDFTPDPHLPIHNQLSQRNALWQLENVMTYPAVRRRMDEGTLSLHAWWFDIASAEVLAFDLEAKDYVLIDEAFVERLPV